jgi:ribosomal protein S18 acetylase RimI-like enzyme
MVGLSHNSSASSSRVPGSREVRHGTAAARPPRGELATIDTVAVHPDHQRRGIGRALFDEAVRRLAELGVPELDAWTRDMPETLAWYRALGFAESSHYLHVCANRYTAPAEPARAVPGRRADLRPVMVFLHAALKDEAAMRREFTRVHVCRRFSLAVGQAAAD